MTFPQQDEPPPLYLKQVPNDDLAAEPFWSSRLHPGCFALDRSFNPPKGERIIE